MKHRSTSLFRSGPFGLVLASSPFRTDTINEGILMVMLMKNILTPIVYTGGIKSKHFLFYFLGGAFSDLFNGFGVLHPILT